MKILYIEDEYRVLTTIIPEVFRNFMTDDEMAQFSAIKKDDYAGSAEIKQLFLNSSLLNVEYDFLEALSLITSDKINQYDYFIFDRNLGAIDKGITFEDIKNVFCQFSRNEYNYIQNNGDYGCEGDYLLSILSERIAPEKLRGKVYVFSAYPSDNVFNNNPVLRKLVTSKILTKDNYIDKSDENGKKQLKDIIENDDKEEMEIQLKWNNILSFYNRYDNAQAIKQTIINALKSNTQTSGDSCSALVHQLDTYYAHLFEKRILKQIRKHDAEFAAFTGGNRISKQAKQEWDNNWYSKAEIPHNIISISNIIRESRNDCEHSNEMDGNVNIGCFTVLACAYALLELARFWQEKKW